MNFLRIRKQYKKVSYQLGHDMRENLSIAKLYKLGTKSLAEVNPFRQVGSVSKAISIHLSL